MPRLSPRNASEWGAVLPQYLGMLGLVFCAAVWLATNRLEPALLTGFGALIVTGQGVDVIRGIRQGPPNPPPVPDTSAGPPPEAAP